MTNPVQKFEQWFREEKEKNGLVDMKFCVGDVSEATPESFCREANSIQEGAFKVHTWDDSYNKKKTE